MPKFASTRPSCSTVLVKEITLGMTMCWRSADGGKAMLVTAHLFLSPIAMVRRALNIPPRFREWRWLLSGYREKMVVCPLSRMSKGGSRMVLT
ncbi:hypothetical protein Prudu_006695 [Prunus dulcis]|uniref:Uncharacterized protein n=1 Tax=Prunus dulcis TaxID=3755 RepID=A0A4Y1R0C0_PRUDU|nr:hypothetical protein Prudu_006695 [Prunus dulcis]